jgi:hypothetical protein
MQVIQRDGYSRSEILDVLHSKNNARNVRFRYYLLNKDENPLRELKTVVSGEVSMSAFSTIKRTAKFKIKEQYIPEHYIRAEGETQQQTWNSQAHWDKGTKTGTGIASNGALTLAYGDGSLIPDANFNSSAWTGGLHPDWNPWGGIASNYLMSTTHNYYGATSKAQYMTRTATGAFGMALKNFVLTATKGETIYLSFFFRPRNDPNNNFLSPSYCYALGDGTVTTNQSMSNYTVTDMGNGWYRFDGSVVAGATGQYRPLVGWYSGTDGSVAVDQIYFNKTKPYYYGEWVSEPVEIKDTYSATFLQTEVWFNSLYKPDPNSFAKVDSRVSKDGGATWSSWFEQGSGQAINGLPIGKPVKDYWVQFRVRLQRTIIEYPSTELTALWFTIKTEQDVFVPEATEINYLQDRIQPVMEVQMNDGNWVAFSLGIFLLSTPIRSDETNGVYRDIEAYDGLSILEDDKLMFRVFFAGGRKYTDVIEELLREVGVKLFNITESSHRIGSSGLEFKVGTSKLEVINTMLEAINYTPLWVDSQGFYTSMPYVSPADRGIDYEYIDDELSVTYNGMEEELDLFSVSNVWVVTQSNPDKPPLLRRKINDDPESITSTVNLGRNIVDFREVQDIADQATLDAYVERIAFESSQIYGKLKFKTALMPFHEYSDILRIRYSGLKIDEKFSETGWTMKLEAGGEMTHEVRRVVKV